MDFSKIVGIDETLPVSIQHHDVYPGIDPTSAYAKQVLAGKVALVTGASRGIGQAIALSLARAGASLALVSRDLATLEKTKASVLSVAPRADVLVFAVDVRDTAAAEAAVQAAAAHFGRLDLLVANAGASTPWSSRIHEVDPAKWWNVLEVNVKGVFNFVRAALPYLVKTNGRIINVSSGSAQVRIPTTSDYATSKFALGRFNEFISIEYPEVTSIALHPGAIPGTELSKETLGDAGLPAFITPDTLELPAAVTLHLATGKADWLNGRYWSVNWDFEEVERDWKEKIIAQNGLVSKLSIPK